MMSGTMTLQIVHMDDSFTEVDLGVEGALTWHHTPTGLTVTHDEVGTVTRWPWATVKSYTVIPALDPIAIDPNTCTNTAPADAYPAAVDYHQAVVEDGTRMVTLCRREDRQSGTVTVGESRVPAAAVLDSIRVRGTREAAAMWPLLSEQDLEVLTWLAVDLDMRAARGSVNDVARGVLTELVALKDGPRDHAYRVKKDEVWDRARRSLKCNVGPFDTPGPLTTSR